MLKEYTVGDMNASFAIGFICSGMLCGLIATVVLGCNDGRWKQDSIKRGYAEYDKQTGAWQWIEKQPKAEAE